eukprot:4836213-Lingulodinium_polyedra.AAC.1
MGSCVNGGDHHVPGLKGAVPPPMLDTVDHCARRVRQVFGANRGWHVPVLGMRKDHFTSRER